MFFKEESSLDKLKHDERHWDIHEINNGIKCIHSSKLYEDYFEYDEIEAINAFEGNKPMTVLDIFNRLMVVTPYTKGFSYNYFNIITKVDNITKKTKGFIIRSRLYDEKTDINKPIPHNKESYVSVEILSATNMRDFVEIILIPTGKDDRVQQILDTEN